MKKNDESAIIASAIREWLGEYLPSRARSPHTIDNYRRTLDLYVRYLETEKNINVCNLSAEAFSFAYIESWLEWLRNERLCGNRTGNNRLAGLRSFLKFLSKKDSRFGIVYLKALDVEQLKYQKNKPEGMSKAAIKALLSIPDRSTRNGKRDLTILSLLYALGARISEILGLRMQQVHLDGDKPYITLLGKGNKTRIGYLMPGMAKLLRCYISVFHGRNAKPNDLLFFSDYGGIRHQLSQDAVSRFLREYAVKAHEKCKDVPINLHSHLLRHARAGIWLEEGLNVVIIKELLGHENLNTTMMYIGISKEQMYDALKKLDGEETSNLCKKWKRKDGGTLSEYLGLNDVGRNRNDSILCRHYGNKQFDSQQYGCK